MKAWRSASGLGIESSRFVHRSGAAGPRETVAVDMHLNCCAGNVGAGLHGTSAW